MDDIQQVKLRRRILNSIIKHENGCWIWRRKVRRQGYASTQYMHNGKYRYTSPHRLSYIVFRNRFDLIENRELFVCHKCDNKDCVNPEHMFVGDWLENAMDDVLRNPKMPKHTAIRIEKLYRERHKLGKSYILKRLLPFPPVYKDRRRGKIHKTKIPETIDAPSPKIPLKLPLE